MGDESKEVFENYLIKYERMGRGYFQPLADIQKFHLERLPRWIDQIDLDARILDAGCATGYLLGLLHETGYRDLTGVDLSAQLISEARNHLPLAVSVHIGDVYEYLSRIPDGAYDVIIFHHVLEHIPRDQTIKLLREFRRCLAKGGLLNIKTPNSACLLAGYYCFGDFTHLVHFNEASMVQVLEQAGFPEVDIEFISHPPILFWSWHHPIRALLRLINRLRWYLHGALHKTLSVLVDQHPPSKVFEVELDILVHK